MIENPMIDSLLWINKFISHYSFPVFRGSIYNVATLAGSMWCQKSLHAKFISHIFLWMSINNNYS